MARCWILVWTAALGISVLLLAGEVRGDVRDGFESPNVSWRLADRDCGLQLAWHARQFGQAHGGQGYEALSFAAGGGTYAYLVHDLAPSRVFDELRIAVWVRSNRTGLRLAARVVLPRETDPETGKPLSLLIYGSTYTQTGSWQQLVVEQPARLLMSELPRLRHRFGSQVNHREAYVDLIVFNVYGGPGPCEVSLDDLEVTGQVAAASGQGWRDGEVQPAGYTAVRSSAAHLQGSVLLADDSPLMVMMVDHHGEPFAWLAELGFNTIRLASPPTPIQLEEAEQLGLWLIAPPPVSNTNVPPTGRVLAWDLGRNLQRRELEATRQTAQRLKADPDYQPLVVCQPGREVWAYSHAADLLILERPVLHGSFSMPQYARWLRRHTAAARLGTPVWAGIPLHVPSEVEQQIRGFGGSDEWQWAVSSEQIRLMVYQAVAAGARGLAFTSRHRLDSPDPAAQQLARALRLINLEVSLLSPWITSGSLNGSIDTGSSDWTATLLTTERARLVLTIPQNDYQQYVGTPAGENEVSFVVHGIPVTDDAYQIGLTGLKRLWQQRGSGVRIVLEPSASISLVVMTQDPRVINYLARRIQEIRQASFELQRDLLRQELALTRQIHQHPHNSSWNRATTEWLEQAETDFRRFDQLLLAGSWDNAVAVRDQSVRGMQRVRAATWQQAVRSFSSPVSSPCCISFVTLPLHWSAARRLGSASWSSNVLPGGDMENLDQMRSDGWAHRGHPEPAVASAVELSLESPFSGRSALRLLSWSNDSSAAALSAEAPSILIQTAPVPVQTGDIARISCWVRVPDMLQHSEDGLMIYDNFGGLPLADRWQQTVAWQRFTLYRVVTRNEPLTVTFALSGLGEAWLDDVTIDLLR